MKKAASIVPPKSNQFDPKLYSRPGMSSDQILEIKQAFDTFDTEKVGSIDPKQLKAAIKALGFNTQNQTIYQLISDMEADGNGNVSFEDFLHLMTTKVTERDSRKDLNNVFALFDDDKTGFVSIQSLRRITKELGENIEEHELQEMMNLADTDNDGLVSQQQFYRLITRKAK